MNRSLVTAIGIPVMVVASAGGLLLTAGHGGPSRGHDAAAGSPSASAAPSPSASPASPSRTRDPRRPARKHPPKPKAAGTHFVGLAVNGDIAGSVGSFTQATGVHPVFVELYTLFGAAFPRLQASRAVAAGSTPFIQWNPRSAPLGEIAAGAYDSYLRSYALAVKAFGHPIVLSFAHEMNGTWYPWGRLHATPAQFIGAWRRIHDAFTSEHVTNVTWSWDPSHTGGPASAYWPGAAYVNWIGIDGYLRPGQTFAQIFAAQLANIRSVTSAPVFIAETAVAPSPGAGQQIGELFSGMHQDNLMGFVWFDINRLKDWRLEGRPAAVQAFRTAARAMGVS